MGKFFSNIGRGLKLAFKTVTFHWKQYFCFFIALLAMETMFGIIVMSSSRNIDEYSKTIDSKYSWHFAMVNLTAGQRENFENNFSDTRHSSAQAELGMLYFVCDDNSSNSGSGIVYMRIEIPESSSQTYESAFNDFMRDTTAKKSLAGMKMSDVEFQFSPLFELDNKIYDMRVECAVKLLVLGLVSIAVIILLLNIRLNHFKFTYGVYMSFGADTKKLFYTSFWDMIVIGLLMFIPAALLSATATYVLYSNGTYTTALIKEFLTSHFPLIIFALFFIIPVCVVAVLIPIKITAAQPPLKLLIAQDNSNLVSSPRVSSQLLGKKFPKAYASLGLFRFRKYVATVLASSVLFASVFVWISFYSTIYDFNTEQEQAEFDVHIDCEMEYRKEYVQTNMTDVTTEFKRIRDTYVYEAGVTPQKKAAFEQFYTAKYRITYSANKTVKDVYYVSSNEKVTTAYITARDAVVKPALRSNVAGDFVYSAQFEAFEEYMRDGNYADGTNNPNVVYIQTISGGVVVKVEQKKAQNVYTYPETLEEDMIDVESRIENLANSESFTLVKSIDFDLFKSDEDKKSEGAIKSNYVYIGFNKENVKAFSGYDYNKKTDKKVTDNVKVYPLDPNGYNLDFLSKYTLDIMGGEKILSLPDMQENGGEKYIIVSETAANSQVLDIKPGDKLEIGYVSDIKGSYDESLRGADLLDELINKGEFSSEVYTVYAVIKDMPTSEEIPVYVLESDYTRITGVKNISNSFSIYLAPNVDAKAVSNLYEELVNLIGDKATIVWNNAIEENRENINMKNLTVIQAIAVFSLVLSPLFWFFSQIMFYGKREDEFRMLRGLGATEREIKKIFRKDARTFALLGIAAMLVFGMLGIFVIYKINMTYVAFFGTGALHLYRFEMPWIAFAISIVVTAICAYLSCIVPYRIDRKKAKRALAREFGDE